MHSPNGQPCRVVGSLERERTGLPISKDRDCSLLEPALTVDTGNAFRPPRRRSPSTLALDSYLGRVVRLACPSHQIGQIDEIDQTDKPSAPSPVSYFSGFLAAETAPANASRLTRSSSSNASKRCASSLCIRRRLRNGSSRRFSLLSHIASIT